MTKIIPKAAMAGCLFALTALAPVHARDADASPSDAPASPFASEAVADESLSKIAGREDTTQVSRAELNAAVSRNSVGDNSRTGDARIADNAFQNLSGLSILNVNTGNNVAINAAMNVNISISPQP